VNVREQLAWEARWARPVAAAALLSVILSVGAGIYVSSQLEDSPDADHTRDLLALIDAQSGVFVTGAVIGAVGVLLLAVVLWYLFLATRARKPELPKVALVLAFVGPVLLAIAAIVVQLDLVDRAGDFLASGPRTEKRADDLVADRPALLQSIGLSGALAVAFATVMISQNAMRVGLLSRFIGILGIVVGALYVLGVLFPLGTDLIRMFWLVAVGLVILGWWPGGRGEAWETGEAAEWPTAAQRRAEALAEAERDDEAQQPAAVNGGGEAPTRSRSSRKRKKKRR
jgi:hypothetical protein